MYSKVVSNSEQYTCVAIVQYGAGLFSITAIVGYKIVFSPCMSCVNAMSLRIGSNELLNTEPHCSAVGGL